MNAPLKSRSSLVADEDGTQPSVVRVQCPGRAHGTDEPCLICDEDDDGTISVLVTELELEALACAAQGRAVDTSLAPRLRLLDLLHTVAGYTVPTERGFALLASRALSASSN